MVDFEAAKDYVLGRLEKELRSGLCYHSYDHTIDVYESAINLAKLEQVNGNDLLLLKTAALYHDTGFLDDYNDHEERSAQMAREVLPDFGYANDDIETIARLITATKLPQNPQTLPEKILCDADLDYLGRDDFFMIAGKLLCEWNTNGLPTSLKKWYSIQAGFLANNNYFTASAIALRKNKKEENLAQILELLTENCQ
jgi:uncharacterized protein